MPMWVALPDAKAEFLRKPYRHVAAAAMAPCVVGYEIEFHIFSHEAAIVVVAEGLAVGGEYHKTFKEFRLLK